ncbi:autotransporter outer membrane beta-barrel domain-containing protein [Paraburkholderia dilworthii]|uniref:Autotransporter outer membrane beta-barrel domain-containing protein n=1 Tax=Paraburkholderia dilworthii TaxID=948106 RepID=A0ABW9DJW6_9BURK
MNKSFKSIWNGALGSYVAVAENSMTRGKGRNVVKRIAAAAGVSHSPLFEIGGRRINPGIRTACAAVVANLAFLPLPVFANCVTSGITTTCDTTAPSPWTSTVGTGASTASGYTVVVQPNAQMVLGDAPAISLGDNANITVNSGALVQNKAKTGGTGLYDTGSNTIEFNNNGMLLVQGGATVISTGKETDAEAVNPQGTGNTIINNGTIQGTNSAAIYFQNLTGLNTVINNATGVIEAPANVIGAYGNGAVDFTNRGLVIGNLVFAGGDDTLHLYTGSVITGNFDGGGGNNVLTLNGTGTGTLPGDIANFQTLIKQDSGTWTLTGALSGVNTAEVQQGILALTGNNSGYTGTMTVDAAGTLQAPAQNLPPLVTDNGLVQFTQNVDGTYAGLISGSGAVEKDGAGTLTLAPSATGGNTYSGGTVLNQGVLSIAADSAIGASTGGVTFNGGTLQLGSSFNLAGTRPIAIESGGGTIDTQGFQSTITQNITGAGALTKLGAGTLVLDGANTYSGGTTVSAGALGVGDASNAGASIAGGGPVSVASGATLGGYGSVTGDVTNNGTISVANAFSQFAGGPNGNFTINGQLVNAGIAQIGGGQTAGNTLTVGSYVGKNATIGLNTYLAGDNAPSDKLIVNGGSATGATSLQVTNVGGPGGVTVSNGIQVVQAINGATTSAGAFTLAGGTIKAGAYEYYLAQGGVTAGTSQDWYLRNTVAPTPTPTPTPTPQQRLTTSPPLPTAADGTPSLPTAGTNPTPLYRPEVSLYAEMPSVARELGMLQVDNFHDRQGEQSLLTENGNLPAAWGRVWGGHSVLSQGGEVNPAFDGSVVGMQAGQDVYANTTASGQRNHYGFFVGFARATGDVSGFAVGVPNADVGHLAINAYSLGGYWTHVGPSGWYTDAVVMASSLVIDPSSSDGISTSTHGNALTGSIEGGLPFAIGYGLTLEPQAQLIWQHLSINDFNDGVSNVVFNSGNTFIGRLGVRLTGSYEAAGKTWQPYLRLNLLRSFGASDTTTFAGVTPIGTSVGQTNGQIGAGLVAKLTKQGSAFATVSYTANLGGEHQRTVTGNVGVRWAW